MVVREIHTLGCCLLTQQMEKTVFQYRDFFEHKIMFDHLYYLFVWRDLLFLEIEEKRAECECAHSSWGLEDELCDSAEI